MSILNEIFGHKKIEVEKAKQTLPTSELAAQIKGLPAPANFAAALKNEKHPAPRLIAEVKHRSPSKGILAPDFDPLELAEAYAENGAAAISVLTDRKYFGGSLDYLQDINSLGLGLPLLRKDFIFDAYQLLEARASGASAALLIAAMLEQDLLESLVEECSRLGLTALVEVHDEPEMLRAIQAGATVIGINNRNLHDFNVDINLSIELSRICPPEIVLVAESGIKSREDVDLIAPEKIDAILVGEGLVTAVDVGEAVRSFTRVRAQ